MYFEGVEILKITNHLLKHLRLVINVLLGYNVELRAGRGEMLTLSQGHYLLQFKNVLVEIVLKSLVGEVDAELLEAVVLVVFEAEDVENPNGQDLKK